VKEDLVKESWDRRIGCVCSKKCFAECWKVVCSGP
jgi:hypothetical protein